MNVFSVPGIKTEPTIHMENWAVVANSEGDRVILGTHLGSWRKSSKIQKMVGHEIITYSGRRYTMGKQGLDDNGLYILSKLGTVTDVSHEYFQGEAI